MVKFLLSLGTARQQHFTQNLGPLILQAQRISRNAIIQLHIWFYIEIDILLIISLMYRYVKGTVKLLKGEVTKLGDRFEYFVNLRPERYSKS